MPVRVTFDAAAAQGRLARVSPDVVSAMRQLGDEVAQELQARMRANAPWTDRTGAARQGLRASVAATSNGVAITLAHTVAHGLFLELKPTGNGGRPILLPTIEQNQARVLARFSRLVSD